MAVSNTKITLDHLTSLIGTHDAPVLIDVRIEEDFSLLPALIPGSYRLPPFEHDTWANIFTGQDVVVICDKGLKLSEGVAAWLRQHGARAWSLEGGFRGWEARGLPTVPADKIPPRNTAGQTVWVTRSRPKIDRIACPWLIRRFVDPKAVFLYVEDSQVSGVAEKFGATPFDIEDVFWSHRGANCTFDTMVAEFGLTHPALTTLATIIRGADTGRPDLAPQSAGLLAASLGLSQMYVTDLQQLDAGLMLYDALYRWARDASGETHTWPAAQTLSPQTVAHA